MRPKGIVVNFYDENGKSFTIEDSDFLARIIQHEMDHLNGILFIDYYEERIKNKLLKPYMRERGLKTK